MTKRGNRAGRRMQVTKLYKRLIASEKFDSSVFLGIPPESRHGPATHGSLRWSISCPFTILRSLLKNRDLQGIKRQTASRRPTSPVLAAEPRASTAVSCQVPKALKISRRPPQVVSNIPVNNWTVTHVPAKYVVNKSVEIFSVLFIFFSQSAPLSFPY